MTEEIKKYLQDLKEKQREAKEMWATAFNTSELFDGSNVYGIKTYLNTNGSWYLSFHGDNAFKKRKRESLCRIEIDDLMTYSVRIQAIENCKTDTVYETVEENSVEHTHIDTFYAQIVKMIKELNNGSNNF